MTNSNTSPDSESDSLNAVNLFKQLQINFAQTSMTDEEAYLEIAKKLMKLSDVLPSLEKCMEAELNKKYPS